jgi:hypothetical protein
MIVELLLAGAWLWLLWDTRRRARAMGAKVDIMWIVLAREVRQEQSKGEDDGADSDSG